MNKKLICLTLSILMLLACAFTSCSTQQNTTEDGEEEATVDNSAKTIVMWVVTEDETTPEAEELVNEAFTKLTKSKFKTNVVMRFCTEDEYYDKLEEAIETAQHDIEMQEMVAKELRTYKKEHKGEKDESELEKDFFSLHPEWLPYAEAEEDEDEEVVTEEETFVNDLGIKEIKYPDPKPNQVDIFYLGSLDLNHDGEITGDEPSGYNKYMEYYEQEWLASLSEELGTSSKKLNDYISASLLQGVQIEGGVYAIPNNVSIGEYTYMMIDKTLFDMYFQKIDKVGSVLDLKTFLKDVSNYNIANNKGVEDEGYVVPLASSYEDCIKMLCWYWDISYVDQSVYKTHFDETTGRTYVLKEEYIVKEETEDGKTKDVPLVGAIAEDGVVYKTNSNGEFVDANGQVLGYRYEVDEAGGFVETSKGIEYLTTDVAKGSVYLVDKDGVNVTAENDQRVQVEAETKRDANARVLPTYYYIINKDADFSILGTMMKDAASRTRGGINLGFNTLFTNTEYHEMYATLKDYEYNGYYGTVAEGQSAAVSFVKGDVSIKLACEDDGVYKDKDGKEYYVVVAEYPEATEAELYGNMFAVYANSSHLSRAMEVLTYLNTNKEMRDLLQYGVKGQHYEITDEGTARPLSEAAYGTYRMRLEATGNCFIATPPVGMTADAWDMAKIQNNDSLIDPLLGFDFNLEMADSDTSLDVTLIDHIKTLNAEALALIAECNTKEDLMTLMTDTSDGFVYKHSVGYDNVIKKAVNPAYDPEQPLGPEVPDQKPDKNGSNPYTIYQNWLTRYGYAYVPTTDK